MDKRPIGIFDSGLGGLTCVREIMKIMPGEDVIYFGDTGRVPYGTRSREMIIKYVEQDIRFLESFDIKAIIIACGTASSAALPWIAEGKTAKIMGVVEPAAKMAVKATRNKKIGVLGTSATVKYGKYVENIKSLCPDAEIIQKACPMFVPIVENGYTESPVAEIIAKEYLSEVKAAGVDTLILGCTHYPLLRKVIGDIMGEGVTLIDSGAAAANCAHEFLKAEGLLKGEGEACEKGRYRYFVSDEVEDFSQLGGVFLERPIDESVQKIDIEKY
ncbi:MAG: glutamate racemase [Ruminococcaceae bacterium]|nr:glutamate racemase [Oscillospiraceae bacterium]